MEIWNLWRKVLSAGCPAVAGQSSQKHFPGRTGAAAVATAATKPPSEEAPRALNPHYGTAYSISLLLVITACRFGTKKGAGS